MAALSNHVTISITQDTVGIARAGFGVGLYLSPYASGVFASGELTREYTSLAAVATDFATTTSPEYLAASAYFGQNPKPSKMKIGAQSLPPTIAYTLVPTVRNAHVYTLTIGGKGFATRTLTTAATDGSATATEICDLFRTLLNAVAGKNFTATGTTTLIVTANTAGDWFWIQTDTIADWSANACAHADPGVATDLAAIALYDNDWYCLLSTDPGNASILAGAAWIEANKKINLPEVAELQAITTALANSDTLDDLHTLGYARTAGVYHPTPGSMNAIRWAATRLWTEPGAESWKFAQPTGIAATVLTDTHRAHLISRCANFLETVAGAKVMSEGTTCDGDFIDVTRGLDWLEDDMAKSVFGALVSAGLAGSKIPFDDDGIAVIEAQMKGSLRRAVKRGILAKSPAPTVTVPLAADISDADKAARRLPDCKFTGTLAGAIHKVNLSGTVSV